MQMKFARLLQSYYLLVLLVLGLILSFGVYLCWNSGFFNDNETVSAYQTTLRLNYMRERDPVGEISRMVRSDNPKSALQVTNYLEKESQSLNSAYGETEGYSLFSSSLVKSKKELNKLAKMAHRSAILAVLLDKIVGLEKLTSLNRWPTLSKLARNMRVRVRSLSTLRSKRGDLKKLESGADYIALTLQKMRTITANSVLSARNKNQVYIRLNTISSGVALLNKYVGAAVASGNASEKLLIDYNTWLDGLVPEASQRTVELDKNSRTVLFGLLAALFLVVVAIGAGIFIYDKNEQIAASKVESIASEVVSRGVLQYRGDVSEDFSPQFRREMEKYRAHVHKRTSFSTIFQEALPFSALLLDSNLKVVWGNNVFYEQWKIENRDMEISWDYLLQFTNLGDNDPITAALYDNVAGIYNVQVKRTQVECDESLPFEMYVSSVESFGEKRIMVLFYPLRNMQEALSEQTKAIAGPVSRILDSLIKGSYEEDKQGLEKDFAIASIEPIWQKFESFASSVELQKESLAREIDLLEDRLRDKFKTISDMKELLESDGKASTPLQNILYSLKESMVKLAGVQGQLQEGTEDLLGIGGELINNNRDLIGIAQKSAGLVEQNKKDLGVMLEERKSLKSAKTQVDQNKENLLRLVDRIAARIKGKSGPVLEAAVLELGEEVQALDKALTPLGNVIQSINLGLSKVEMATSEVAVMNLKGHEAGLQDVRRFWRDRGAELADLGGGVEAATEELIGILKKLSDFSQTSRHTRKALMALVPDDILASAASPQEGLSQAQV